MSEAQIIIRTRVVGDAAPRLGQVASQAKAAASAQEAASQRAQSGAERLDATYERVAQRLGRVRDQAASVVGQMMSLKSVALGFATAGAGKTIFDAMIGSNVEMEQRLTAFRVILGDAQKAELAVSRIRKYASETPFAESELIEGSKRLLRLTGDNVDENLRLLKVASQLKALAPSKSLEDAVEALLAAEGQGFDALKGFGIQLKAEDIKRSRKRGETLGQAALRGVEDGLNKITGGRDVVAALSQTFAGKLSTLKDNVANTIAAAGEPAFEVLKRGLDDVSADFAKLQADPQFKRDLKDLSIFAADMARSATKLAAELPGAINQARTFIGENKTLLKVAGGAFVANKLTGGALGQAALSGSKRLLFGSGAGAGPVAALGAATSGATPVFVVNWSGQGGLADALGGAASKAAGSGAAATGGRGVLSSLAQRGVVGTLGAGPSLAIAGGAAFLGAQLYTLGQITQGSTRALEGFERRADEAEKAQRERSKKQRDAWMGSITKPIDERVQEERTSRISGAMTMLGLGRADKAKSELMWEAQREGVGQRRAGESRKAFEQRQRGFLAPINEALNKQGVEARIGKGGELEFEGGLIGAQFDRYKKLQRNNQLATRRFGARFTESEGGQQLMAEEERLRQRGLAGAARARALNEAQVGAQQTIGAPELVAIRDNLAKLPEALAASAQRTFNITVNAANVAPDEFERMMRRLMREMERDAAQTGAGS